MRRTIVLMLISVLATGAVANAEEMNIIDDPSKLINIEGVYGLDSGEANAWSGSKLADGDQLETTALLADAPFFSSTDDELYKLQLEIHKENGDGVLDQASICFFDSNILTDAPQRSTTCGSGIDAQGTALDFSGTKTGESKPQSALQIGFIPAVPSSTSNQTSPIQNIDPQLGADQNPNHKVSPTVFAGTKSTITETSEFDGDSSGLSSDSVWKLEILFRPSDMAHNTGGWKIRVFTKYLDSSDVMTEQELISANSYGVLFTSSIETNLRGDDADGQVNYGDVVAGSSVQKTGIDTASYRANNDADITLNPDKFSGGGQTLDFGTLASEVNLSCGADPSSLIALTAGEATKILSGVEGISEPATDARLNKSAPTHDCTLDVGADVPIAPYTNVMTMAIGKAN